MKNDNKKTIINYNEINNEIKDELTLICEEDQYGLNPETLYKNISNSTGTNEKLAELYDVSISLVKKIKSINT